MRKFLLFITFFVLAKVNFAQSVFAPVGSYFSYTYSGFFSNGLQTLYYSSDTTINGQSIKVICRAGYYTLGNPGPPSFYSSCDQFILERNDSIFQYGGMQLLYTFNMSIGDSIVFNDTPGPTNEFRYKIVLDSIGIDTICGISRDMLYYSKIQDTCPSVSTPVTIARGIGPIDDYLFSQPNCIHSGAHYSLNCINLGNCNYPSGNCANQPFALKEHTALKYSLTNTPVGISIQFSEQVCGTFIISNILGSITHKEQLKDQPSVEYTTSQLSPGIYMFTISSSDGKKLSGKFLVE